MKTSSIQFKFSITVISAILAITVFIGGISVYEVDNYIQQQTQTLITATCKNEASQINSIFGDMEKSVEIIESYVLSLMKSEADVTDPDKRNEIIKSTDKMFAEVAKHTDSVIAYYLRFAPELSDSTSGLFYSKTNDNDGYVSFQLTDLLLYDKDDTEHVGWYWQPYQAGKAIWMLPYYNQNLGVSMISYVVPLYCGNRFIGVVGMDFNYTVLADKVNQIKVYENGYAHLEIDDVIIHSNNQTTESSALPENFLHVSEDLTNGMTLVLSADYNDIRQIRYDIAFKILFVVTLLAILFCFIVFLVVRRIVTPLKELTEASQKLSEGDYDVEIAHSNTYEIKMLTAAFENMAANLREHKRLQLILAYRDPLTKLQNATAFKTWAADFSKELQSKHVAFGIIVFDINYLKNTNDRYGHNVGDKLIVCASNIISNVFKNRSAYRLGGDEFIVILQNSDLDEYEKLLEKLHSECAKSFIPFADEKIPISIASGVAIYDPAIDAMFEDVLNRADDAMYKNKRDMKIENAIDQHIIDNGEMSLSGPLM